MTPRRFQAVSLALSLAGTIFSGYLSGVKLLTSTCAFNEPCPYFLGYPACWFGLGLFLVLLGISAASFFGKLDHEKSVRALTFVSSAGTLFAGYLVVPEVYGWATVGLQQGYGLVLPTCVYGLAVFAALLILAVRQMLAERLNESTEDPSSAASASPKK